jgi:hypothetical protein
MSGAQPSFCWGVRLNAELHYGGRSQAKMDASPHCEVIHHIMRYSGLQTVLALEVARALSAVVLIQEDVRELEKQVCEQVGRVMDVCEGAQELTCLW